MAEGLQVKITPQNFHFQYGKHHHKATRSRNFRGYTVIRDNGFDRVQVNITDKHLIWNGRHVSNVSTNDNYVKFEACPQNPSTCLLLFAAFGALVAVLLTLVILIAVYQLVLVKRQDITAISPSGEFALCGVPTTYPGLALTRTRNDRLIDFIGVPNFLAEKKTDIQYHVTDRGIVFATGPNMGKFILYLNPNTELHDQDTIKDLLSFNRKITTITSPNLRYTMTFKPEICAIEITSAIPSDTNFVRMYFTPEKPCSRMMLLNNNDLVVYDKDNQVVWTSKTATDNHHTVRLTELVLTDWGGLVLRWKDTQSLRRRLLRF